MRTVTPAWTIHTALVLAAGAALACSPRVTVGSNKNDSLLSMTFVAKSYDNPIFRLAHNGALQATYVLNKATGRSVSVEDQSPLETALSAQEFKVRQAIEKGTSGIILSCVDIELTSSIADAAAKGIPVITFDSDCPDSKRIGYYGTANAEAGAKAADLLVTAMNNQVDGKRVAILTGNEGADNLKNRIAGFKSRLSEKYSGLQVLEPYHCDENPKSCGDVLENQILAQYPDLDGLLVVGLWGVEAACPCDFPAECVCGEDQVSNRSPNWHTATKSGHLKTVAFDAHPFELELLKQGYLSALIGQRYYEWGYCTVPVMFDYITRGKKVEFPTTGGYYVVHPEDVEPMLERWSELYAERKDASASDESIDCSQGGL